jgi:uncharacterized protein YndB with AHSA1/START domain
VVPGRCGQSAGTSLRGNIAFVDPAITTKFWFTKSSGKMMLGAVLQWDWEMYDVSTKVRVKEVEDNRRIRFEWDDDEPTTVELRFVPWQDDATYVQVTETGFGGDGDEIVSRVAGSTGGFYQVLCALKALLEHNVILTVVLDHTSPKGLEL